MSLDRYIELFSDLKPNRSSGRASPHKACLLLAVIDLIDEGVLTDNRIPFDASLKDAFRDASPLLVRSETKIIRPSLIST